MTYRLTAVFYNKILFLLSYNYLLAKKEKSAILYLEIIKVVL